MNKKELKENIIIFTIMILIFLLILLFIVKAFTITEKDQKAYNTCLNNNNNDVKLCKKIIYGIY